MIFIKLILFLTTAISFDITAQTRFKYPKAKSEIIQDNESLNYINNQKISAGLRKIKLEIIRGNTQKANLLLSQAKYTTDFSKTIQYRYQALSYFIDSEYRKTLEILNKKEFSLNTNYQKICAIKTFSYLAIGEYKNSKVEWKKCYNLTYFKSKSYNIWLDSFIVKREFKEKYIKETFKKASVDSLKLFLKLALYLDQQSEVLKYIEFISINSLANTEIRELIAFAYYKDANVAKAFEYMDGIETSNILNVKANFLILQGKYEMAYSQFKLAYKKKKTSTNAIKRLIPLSWIYKKWDEALEYSSLDGENLESNDIGLFQAAVLSQKNEYKSSNNLLLYRLKQKNRNSTSINSNLLLAFNYINLEKNLLAQSFTEKACYQKDGLSCLFQFHFSYWDNFSKTINSSVEIVRSDILSKYIENKLDDPLKVKQIINQRNLELLDEQDGHI